MFGVNDLFVHWAPLKPVPWSQTKPINYVLYALRDHFDGRCLERLIEGDSREWASSEQHVTLALFKVFINISKNKAF